MSHYTEQRENNLYCQKISRRISRWKEDCGFTPTESQTSLNENTASVIQTALSALSCLYSIPKVRLHGISVEHYLKAKHLNIFSQEEISIVWSSNQNYGKLSTLAQQLLSLKILCQQLELANFPQQYPSSARRLLHHRLTICQSMIGLLLGSTVIKLVKEEVLLLDNLAAFLQKLITLSQNMTPNSIPNNK